MVLAPHRARTEALLLRHPLDAKIGGIDRDGEQGTDVGNERLEEHKQVGRFDAIPVEVHHRDATSIRRHGFVRCHSTAHELRRADVGGVLRRCIALALRVGVRVGV